MPVVTLSAFVVVPNPVYARSAVVQPVLVAVRARSQWLGELPNDDLDDRAVVTYLLGLGVEHRRHIFHGTNICTACPLAPNVPIEARAPPLRASLSTEGLEASSALLIEIIPR